MKIKITLLTLFLLAACGQVAPPAAETPTTAATLTALPSFTLGIETPTPLPTFTPEPPLTATYYASLVTPNTLTPTTFPTPKPIPISTATEIFSLENLRMAYIVDGNLYVQNGSNPPTQLSDSGEDLSPMFSNDGEKIVFYRGKSQDKNSIFSINADGSHKQEIITKSWLDTLGAGTKAGHLAFIPNTHQILFNTYLCPKYDPSSNSGCTVGLFLIDSDTGKTKEIMKPVLGGWLPIGGDALWIRNFSISPDGKLLSIAHAGQIDIFDVEGNIIHQGIMKYPPGMPFELYARVYWLSDSSGLIVALPAESEYVGPLQGGDPDYTIWRYTFDGNSATQIPLDPPSTWIHMVESNDVLSVSPNREWVLYFTEDYKLYKANLLDGSTELIKPYGYFLRMQWNLESTYFAGGGSPVDPIFGSVDAPPSYPPGYFLGWIDANRFIYFPFSAYTSKDNIPILVGEIDEETISSYETKVFVPNMLPYVTFAVLESK